MSEELRAECGCAYVLQTMTKRLRPAVKRAYDAPDHATRTALLADAVVDAESIVAALRSLIGQGPASPLDAGESAA